jgi:hypothetical protein
MIMSDQGHMCRGLGYVQVKAAPSVLSKAVRARLRTVRSQCRGCHADVIRHTVAIAPEPAASDGKQSNEEYELFQSTISSCRIVMP